MTRSPLSIRSWWRRGAALAAVLMLSGALAEELQVSLELGTDRRGRTTVTAEVTDAEGNGVSRREVELYLIPDFFPNAGKTLHGGHPVLLGSDTTNVAGQAEIRYSAPYTGTSTFEARVTGADGEISTGQLEAEIVREADPAPEPAEIPLAEVRRPLERTILAVVIAVWLFLFGLTFTTGRRIYRLGKEVV